MYPATPRVPSTARACRKSFCASRARWLARTKPSKSSCAAARQYKSENSQHLCATSSRRQLRMVRACSDQVDNPAANSAPSPLAGGGLGRDRFLFFSCCLQDAEILLRAPRKKISPVTQNVTCVCNTIRVYFRHDRKVCRSPGGPPPRAFFMPACGSVRPRLR